MRRPRTARRGSTTALLLAAVGVLLAGLVGPTTGPAMGLAGGNQTPVGEFPWTVSIAPPAGCTGTLIAPTWVLTAAHCEVQSMTPVVRVGSWSVDSGGEEIPVIAQFLAPGWVKPAAELPFATNDLMLMQLATPATQPTLALARPDQAGAWAPGTRPAFAGFGLTCGPFVYGDPSCAGIDMSAMHDAQLPVIDAAPCAADYPTAPFDPAILLCTATTEGGVSPCFGDSGGALVATTPEGPVLAGVISGGGDPCGAPDAPAVFGRVTAFLDWIAAVTGVVPPPAPSPSTTVPTSTSTSTSTSVPVATVTPVAAPVAARPAFTG